MIAKILQNLDRKGKLTGGFNKQILTDIESMGMITEKVNATEIVTDYKNKIVSTPAYVEANSIKEVAGKIEKLADAVLSMV